MTSSTARDRLQSPLELLGGLTPHAFMKRHWQRKPLLIRGAWPNVQPPANRSVLFELAAGSDVESRCIEQGPRGWRLRHGPLARRALPPLSRPGWTLLVQGLDLHLEAAHRMLRAFDFIPQARVDDLMLSYASDGGGVGPHVDSYDVFLLQVQGRRRWRIARPGDASLVPGLPLRILANFEAEQEWVLEPGDMLYLPPGWGHDGVAVGGDCMTASIGFRSPSAGELAAALLVRMADELVEDVSDASAQGMSTPWTRRHRDPGLVATLETGRIPSSLEAFAQSALERLMREPDTLRRALGIWLTEPKPLVWFQQTDDVDTDGLVTHGLELDRRTRIAYDDRHLFLNGEAYRVGGRDAGLLHRLADDRCLDAAAYRRLGAAARDAVSQWTRHGWMHPRTEN